MHMELERSPELFVQRWRMIAIGWISPPKRLNKCVDVALICSLRCQERPLCVQRTCPMRLHLGDQAHSSAASSMCSFRFQARQTPFGPIIYVLGYRASHKTRDVFRPHLLESCSVSFRSLARVFKINGKNIKTLRV